MRIKLKLINRTDWDTRQLRKFFLECMKKEGCNYIQLLLDFRRNNAKVWGRAYFNSWHTTIYLPNWVERRNNEKDKWERVQLQELNTAHCINLYNVFWHEFAHNRGIRHEDMLGGKYITSKSDDWIKDWKITRKQQKPKEKRNLKQERYEKAKKLLEGKERQLKRLQNQIKKWKLKVKYYEKKMETSRVALLPQPHEGCVLLLDDASLLKNEAGLF